jgi:hypothetical protein
VSITAINPLAWTLREVARLARGGTPPLRLTEPDFERWHRVRRKLGWVAFIDLLHEDLAGASPASFEPKPYRLEDIADAWRRFQLVPRGVSS